MLKAEINNSQYATTWITSSNDDAVFMSNHNNILAALNQIFIYRLHKYQVPTTAHAQMILGWVSLNKRRSKMEFQVYKEF
jgi:hypothetical protein